MYPVWFKVLYNAYCINCLSMAHKFIIQLFACVGFFLANKGRSFNI